jgi:FixJ family two-component response regulator
VLTLSESFDDQNEIDKNEHCCPVKIRTESVDWISELATTIQAALDRGLIHGFIEKPFSHTEVVQTVKHALREYQSKDRPQSTA